MQCPELVVVPPRMQHYRAVSREVFAIFADGAKAVEGMSLDEAFVDIGTDDDGAVVAFAKAFASACAARSASP